MFPTLMDHTLLICFAQKIDSPASERSHGRSEIHRDGVDPLTDTAGVKLFSMGTNINVAFATVTLQDYISKRNHNF